MPPLRPLALVLRVCVLGISLFARSSATDSRGRETDAGWLKVATEHFTILTPAGEGVARKWAVEFEEFRRGLQNLVPVDVDRLRPVTVVLFNNDREMEPFVPLERGEPARVGGMFVRANDINTIMLSLAREARETRHMIFHEAVHWHLSALEGVMPLWLAEGLAELYATFELPDAKTYAFGAARPGYVRMLRHGRLLPLAELLAIDRDSLLYNEGTRASIFYAQSWAFVHFLFYGEDSPGRAAVVHHLELLRTGQSSEDAFVQAFRAGPAELEQRLRRYIDGGTYLKHTYARPNGSIARKLTIAPAKRADLELAKGSLLFGTRTPGDAEPHIRRAAALAPSDPRPWELLGHIAVAQRDYPAAAGALAKAAAAGSTSYLVYHNLAVARLPEPPEIDPRALGLPGARVEPAQMDAAAADYRHALALVPSHVPSYEGLAGLIYGMQTFHAADVELLSRGLLLSPGNTMIETGVAAGEIRLGRGAEGRARLERLCARNADRHDAAAKFARRILADETLKSEIEEVDRLAKQNRFAEIATILEGALARDLVPAHRKLVHGIQRRMRDFRTIVEAVDLANRGERGVAKENLKRVIASAADQTARSEAQQVLRELEKFDP